jgi:hypothetical protein
MVALFVYGGERVIMLQGLSEHLAYPAFSISSTYLNQHLE